MTEINQNINQIYQDTGNLQPNVQAQTPAYKYSMTTPQQKNLKDEFYTQHKKTDLSKGFINGLTMPITTLGGAFVGVPIYFVVNTLNRYFIGNPKTEKNLLKIIRKI